MCYVTVTDLLTIRIQIPVQEEEVYNITFIAVNVHTGSPISLIRSEFVQNNFSVIKTVLNNSFSGINGVKLDLLGIFETDVIVNNYSMYFKLYIVPNNTMLASAILGRDLLSKSGFKIEFENNTVSIFSFNNDNEVLCIDYGQDRKECNVLLNINPNLDMENRKQFVNIYNSEYLLKENVNSHNNNLDFDMKIVLKHEQPISFYPRRL